MNSKLILLLLILVTVVFTSGCVQREAPQLEGMPSQISDAPVDEDNYYSEPVPQPVETITIKVSKDAEPAEPKTVSTELLPPTDSLGNNLKRTDKFVSENPEYEQCPYDEMGIYKSKDPFDKAMYAILIYKCRNEQEAVDKFNHKTSSVSFKEVPGYGTEAKNVGGNNLKFYYGIYYVDVGGYNDAAKTSVSKDLWAKADARVRELYDGSEPEPKTPDTPSETPKLDIDLACRYWEEPAEFYNKNGNVDLYTCPETKPQCHISASRDHNRALCCKVRTVKHEYYDSEEQYDCTEILFE